MNKKLYSAAASALMGLSITFFSVNAAADAASDLVRKLVAKDILTEEEGNLLLQSRAQEIAETTHFEVGKKGLKVNSADGDFSMQFGGRLHADVFGHSSNGDLAGGVDPVDGTEIRRGRIYLKGKAYDDFKYMIEADFGGNKTSVKDLFLTYTGFNAPLELTVGNQKHAMSMEVQESSNDIMFTERSLVTALTVPYFDRAIGLNLKGSGDNWSLQSGIYGDTVSSGNKNNDEGHGFGIRGSFAPVMNKEKGHLVHLGLNYGYRSLSDDNLANTKSAAFAYETTNASELKLFNTGAIGGLNDVQTAIVELAAMFGPLSFQTEYAKTSADIDGAADVDLTAFYGQIGYTLTGESRRYKGSDGEFKRLTPKQNFSLSQGTWGAWEVATRYDQIDLNDGLVLGGKGKRYTLALNWYLNPNVRFMADWSRTSDLTNGPIVKANGSDVDDIDAFTLRGQWAF
jgi:phosphate-selective porin OprO and OprP